MSGSKRSFSSGCFEGGVRPEGGNKFKGGAKSIPLPPSGGDKKGGCPDVLVVDSGACSEKKEGKRHFISIRFRRDQRKASPIESFKSSGRKEKGRRRTRAICKTRHLTELTEEGRRQGSEGYGQGRDRPKRIVGRTALEGERGPPLT